MTTMTFEATSRWQGGILLFDVYLTGGEWTFIFERGELLAESFPNDDAADLLGHVHLSVDGMDETETIPVAFTVPEFQTFATILEVVTAEE
jgi:hypothetical protein